MVQYSTAPRADVVLDVVAAVISCRPSLPFNFIFVVVVVDVVVQVLGRGWQREGSCG